MNRRFHVPRLVAGELLLDHVQARHLRDVLRYRAGDAIEVFDNAGQTADAVIARCDIDAVVISVDQVRPAASGPLRLTVAAATPKGSRADWMIEKLSELGVSTCIPLQTARTIVHPESGKLQRWQRIATESAKQCKRDDVMRVLPPASLQSLCTDTRLAGSLRWCLSTAADTRPAIASLPLPPDASILALVGPEGGWTDAELRLLADSGFESVALTRTILRIETAAVAIASLVMLAAGIPGKEPT